MQTELKKLFERKVELNTLSDGLITNQSNILDVKLKESGSTLGEEFLLREKLLEQINRELCGVNTKIMTMLVDNCHQPHT